MKFEKTIAMLFAAIMLLVLVEPVLGAYTLGDYPEPFCHYDADTAKSTCNFFVVAGNDAATADVVGMTDLAARLAEESYELISTSETTTVTGGETEDIPIAKHLYATGYFDQNFDDDDLAGLLDTEVSFSGDTYDFHEEIVLATNSPLICSSLNCSEDDYTDGVYMEVATGALRYYYIFDETINVTEASTTYPLDVEFLGKTLKITSAPAANGDRFTAYVGDSYSLSVGDCVDVEGKTVCLENVGSGGSVIATIEGTKYTISGTETHEGVEIAIDDYFYSDTLAERAATLVIGKDAQETYVNGNKYIKDDNICNNDPEDTDCWEWHISFPAAGTATTGTPPSGGNILGVVSRFVINDKDDNPITTGECYEFPNDYASVCMDSLTVSEDKYTTLEMEVAKGATFNSTSGFDNENVLYIHTDVTEGLQIESSALGNSMGETALSSDTKTQQIWLATDYGSSSRLDANLSMWYLASDGTKTYAGEVPCNNGLNKFARVYYGDTKDSNIEFYCENKTSTTMNITLNITGKTTTDLAQDVDSLSTLWTFATGANGFSYLGSTEGDADGDELKWCRGNSATCNWLRIATKDEDHRTDYGVVIKNPDSNGNGEEVVLEVPNEQVFATVNIKGPGTTITAGGDTVKSVIPIETAVAKLDTEVGDNPGKHLILVGSAAVNKLSAEVMGLTYPTYGASGLFPFSEGQAIIKIYEDAIESGYVALLVAGWSADDTRNAASVMQQYSTFADQLDENLAVIVTSVSASGITAYTETTTE
jgi:hypothetical protein